MVEQVLIKENKKDFIINLSFFLCLCIILTIRILLFFSININFIDSDQPFVWIGAVDYSKLLFYEPRFYGQDYNTFMEGLFAVPLLWLGFPVYYAVPIATHFIYLFPFLFTSIYLFRNQKKENALLVLALVLCLPSGYDILNSLPRGFVTGLFFCSFYILSFLNPHSFRFAVLNTLMCIVGYFVNPNSLIVSFPFAMFLFLNNYKEKAYYYAMFSCLLLVIPLHLLFNQFYKNHPEYVIFELVYAISPAYLLENLRHLDQAFQHINFFMEDKCWCLLLVFAFLAWVTFKKEKILFFTFLSLIFMILFSFLSGKVRDGAAWPFYSFSRMYLGIPLIIGLICARLKLSKMFISTVTVVSLLFSGYKLLWFNDNINYHTEQSHWLGVHLVSLKEIKKSAEGYKAVCEKYHLDRLIISNGFWLSTYLDYGGPAIYPDFPNTEETNSERRYYVREPNKNKVFESFLYISTDYNLDKKLAGRKDLQLEKLDDYGLFLVKKNTLPNHWFMATMRAAESL
ncbi:MAG: hypothetical protein JNL60_17310 [Bacteroidia bacterium]|nr:hypothetical protein [Bacteroidia bacterium]